MTTLIILLISVTLLLFVQSYRKMISESEHENIFNQQEDYIKEISKHLKELESALPEGVQYPLCDRWNPFHGTVVWYLKECKEDISQFSLEEHAHYRGVVKLEQKYQLYRKQELQQYRNSSIIWQKGWCDKWQDGLGAYGLGHDHWSPGRFQYEYDTNKEFSAWLDKQE